MEGPSTHPLRLHLHGPGRAAVSLALLAMRRHAVTTGISGGSKLGAIAAQAALGKAQPDEAMVAWSENFEGVAPGTWVILGVPDDALVAAATEVAKSSFDATTLVLHLSGRQGCEALKAVRTQGASVGVFHPLRSFPTRIPASSNLGGAVVGLSDAASPGVNSALHEFAEILGGKPWVLADATRALYHAGAALVGNGVLGLLDAGKRALMSAGLPEELALEALVSLAVEPLELARTVGPQAALTGPVVRGDAQTLGSHLGALSDHQAEDRDLYLEVARTLLSLSKGRLSDDRVAVLGRLLDRAAARRRES